MTKKGAAWISRRGQVGAATAVELVLEQQPQEPVQQIADALVEDSPYQARQSMSDASVAELAQGMAAAGFQGVLIVRPHSDAAKRRQGIVQLVYGHRRRAAWRCVCQERGEPCLLPVVVREVTDDQLLTVGAQENLQRQDLDPVEEGQIVAWLERAFPTRSQNELGALIGRSSDWMSLRSRVHRLPEQLKERLRQRPRAIAHMLELAGLYERDPLSAIGYADQVVREQVSLDTLRRLVRGYTRPASHGPVDREKVNNRRGAATVVQEITDADRHTHVTQELSDARTSDNIATDGRMPHPITPAHTPPLFEPPMPSSTRDSAPLLELFQEIAAALERIAGRARELPHDARTLQTLAQLERALLTIRHVIGG